MGPCNGKRCGLWRMAWNLPGGRCGADLCSGYDYLETSDDKESLDLQDLAILTANPSAACTEKTFSLRSRANCYPLATGGVSRLPLSGGLHLLLWAGVVRGVLDGEDHRFRGDGDGA